MQEGLLAVCRARIAGVKEDMGPCLDKSESGAGHLATLATPPVLSDTRLKDPSDSGHNSESESEVGGAAAAHGRGQVQGQLACTNTTDRSGPPWRGPPSVVLRGASSGGGHCVAKGAWGQKRGACLKGPNGLGPEFKGKAEAPQPRTVETCTRPNGLHKGGRPRHSRGRPPPVVLRGASSGGGRRVAKGAQGQDRGHGGCRRALRRRPRHRPAHTQSVPGH
jgi:hypothetical protein